MATSGILVKEESEDEYEDDFEAEEGEPSPPRAAASSTKAKSADPSIGASAASGGGAGGLPSGSTVGKSSSGRRRSSASAGWQSIGASEISVGDRLGGGGFAVVHSGVYKGENVAIKMIVDPKVDEALKKEFMDELQVMSCGHSVFSLLHGSGGPSKRPKPRDPKDLVRWATDAALALEYLHGRTPGIIHRDLKSHNVLVSRDGSAKLCDFGLVQTKVTAAGTPPYMAPELLQDKPFSRKVDAYAFGMMLWEFFAQRVPLAGMPLEAIKERVPKGHRPDMHMLRADTPDAVRELIPRCSAATPADRPDFTEIVGLLRAWKPKKSAVDALRLRRGGDQLDALLGGGGMGAKGKGGVGGGSRRRAGSGARAAGGGGGGGFGR